MKKIKNNKKIVVAMSGGVDSSVATALLKRAGFDVVGVFMKFWQPPRSGGTRIHADSNADLRGYENRCCSTESENLARAVAKQLDIPFYVLNAEKEFKKKVVDYFLKEYKAGNTPNPCIICNKEIKFGLLIEKALKLGANFIATGHYAGVFPSEKHNNFPRRGKFCSALGLALPLRGNHGRSPSEKFSFGNTPAFSLFRGKDRKKDQSYFLWQLNQKQLSRVLFPVGDFTKLEVKKLAKKFKLPSAETPESQEVCFIKNTTNEFLKKYLKTNPGKIVEFQDVRHPAGCRTSPKTLGKHQGLWFYTIGQRKGIGLSGGPYYVVAKDFKNNILIVSKNQKDLDKKELIASNVNWIFGKYSEFCDRRNQSIKIFGKNFKLPISAEVKIRYRSDFAKAEILNFHPVQKSYDRGIFEQGRVKIIFQKPQRAITPGQSVVFYSGQELLGGGVIEPKIGS